MHINTLPSKQRDIIFIHNNMCISRNFSANCYFINGLILFYTTLVFKTLCFRFLRVLSQSCCSSFLPTSTCLGFFCFSTFLYGCSPDIVCSLDSFDIFIFIIYIFSSPEPKRWAEGSGWAIMITCHLLSSIHLSSVHTFERPPLKPLGQLSSNFMWSLLLKEDWKKICTNGHGQLIMMATMLIYGKNTLKSSPEPRKL